MRASSQPGLSERLLPTAYVLLALALYVTCWPVIVGDVDRAFVPWLSHIVTAGPVSAFSRPFSDYTPPYLYLLVIVSPLWGILPPATLIKLASSLGTVALALSVWQLLTVLRVATPSRYAAMSLLLPGVALNAAMIGQCDALYVAPLVMAGAAAVGRRHLAMFIWCGVAIAVKVQAGFTAPFFLGLAIGRRIPPWQWLAAPAATLAMMTPALLAGWPLSDLATIYVRQAGFFTKPSSYAPNIWAIAQTWPGLTALPVTMIGNVAALAMAAVYVAWISRRRFEGWRLIGAAALSPLLVAGLLPRMHERYFLAADVLSFAYAAVAGRRDAWGDAALVQLASFLGIAAFFSTTDLLAQIGALVAIAATVRIATRISMSDEPMPRLSAHPIAT